MFFFLFFRGFFPVVVNFLRRVPVIGNILNLPGISSVSFLSSYVTSKIIDKLKIITLMLETHSVSAWFRIWFTKRSKASASVYFPRRNRLTGLLLMKL